MKAFILFLPLLFIFQICLAQTRCGLSTVDELLEDGWELENESYIRNIYDHLFVLEDGTKYQGDMTVGILEGDYAIVLRKFVRSENTSGYIRNLCAGGFESWVTIVSE